MRLLFIIFICFSSSCLYSTDFSSIDSLINSGIKNKYYPGAQLLIGNNEKVLYEKCYGKFSYSDSSDTVDFETLYDLASLTKVIVTTTAIMILYENGRINLDDKVIEYIPEFNNNNKDGITIKNLLLHNSGLIAWIPFFKTCKTKNDVLNIIYNQSLESPTGSKFIYSDLNFVLLGIIVERVSGMNLSEFSIKRIFEPLEMKNSMYNPDKNIIERIPPTEKDNHWRIKQLKGEVHDETAFLLDGISGNAGLFSNCRDLYKLTKILVNLGKYYGSKFNQPIELSFIRNDIIEMFTTRFKGLNYENTRCLGWDSKPKPTNFPSPCGDLISENCFGHTGYTGTSIWSDKDRNIIVIFLTNRIYPSRNNDGIKYIRPDLHNKIISILSQN